MGRHRRTPLDEKDAKELDRLRKNQQRCRDRKLGLVDEYNKKISETKLTINDKILRKQILTQEFNQLRLRLQMRQDAMSVEEKDHFLAASKAIDSLEIRFIELQQFVRDNVMTLGECQINRRRQEDEDGRS